MRYSDIDNTESKIIIEKIKASKWYDRNYFFMRGSNTHEEDVIELKIDQNRDRTPRDISIEVHNKLNEFSYKKLGYKVRNGLFLHISAIAMGEFHYGSYRIIVPKNDAIIFTNHSITDLYGDTLTNGLTDDDIINYLDDIEVVTPDMLGELESECMGFGSFYSISLDFAVKHDLFNFIGQSINSYEDVDDDPDGLLLLDTMLLPNVVLNKEDIIKFANISFNQKNIRHWVKVLILQRLHTHRIVQNRLFNETPQNIANIIYMSESTYALDLFKFMYYKNSEFFYEVMSDSEAKSIIVRKLYRSFGHNTKYMKSKLGDELYEIYEKYKETM